MRYSKYVEINGFTDKENQKTDQIEVSIFEIYAPCNSS